MATYNDNFNSGAINPLTGTNWTTLAYPHVPCQQTAGGTIKSTVYGIGGVKWTANTFANDQFSQIKIINTGVDYGPIVRVNDSSNAYYLLLIGTGVVFFYYYNGSTHYDLGVSNSYSLSIGDILKLSVVGTILTASVNGTVLPNTCNNAAIASGRPGVYLWDVSETDDWSGGDISPGDTTPPTVDSFTLSGSTSSTRDLTGITFTASDAVGVTGYLITGSATPPAAAAITLGSAPTTYTCSTDGAVTLYPWVKDAAGNVSAVFVTPRTVTITLPTGDFFGGQFFGGGFFTATSGANGTLVATETSDSSSATGTVSLSGTFSATETSDTVTIAANVTSTGALAATETSDAAVASGTISVSGTLVSTETSDSSTSTGTITLSGTLAATETSDAADFAGSVGSGIFGALAATETSDSSTASGTVSLSGAIVVTESSDTCAISGTITATGTLSATETSDSSAVTATITLSGLLSATETSDTASFTGTVTAGVVTGTLAATEPSDAATFAGSVTTLLTLESLNARVIQLEADMAAMSAGDFANAVWAHSTATTIAVQLAEAWGRLGLDPSKPLITGQASITFGQIVMAMTGDSTATTVTRQ